MGECELLYLGHSFVNRWKRHLESTHGKQREFSSILQLPCTTKIQAVGGLFLHSGPAYSILKANSCRFVIADLATNDLNGIARNTTLEEHLQVCKERLSKLLTAASRQGVLKFMLVQVTDRYKFSSSLDAAKWKVLRDSWNAYIYSLTGSKVNGMTILTWLHDRSSLKSMKQGVISDDKLHPNLPRGLHLYSKSLVQAGRAILRDHY